MIRGERRRRWLESLGLPSRLVAPTAPPPRRRLAGRRRRSAVARRPAGTERREPRVGRPRAERLLVSRARHGRGRAGAADRERRASASLGTVRFTAERWPRFAIDAVHRDVSLLVMVVLVIHIVTSVLDGFAPITLLDGGDPVRLAVPPAVARVSGTLSFDLLLVAIVATSLVRRRLGYRSWRAIHWLAYASWPVAVLHGLGTGSDSQQWWMLALTVVCMRRRAGRGVDADRGRRSRHETIRAARAGAGARVVTPLGLAIFTLAGPLQRGWAGAPGRPASCCTRPPRVRATAGPRGGGCTRSPRRRQPRLHRRLSPAALREPPRRRCRRRPRAQRDAAGSAGKLRVRIAGAPVGGGLSMTGSQVDLRAAGVPSVFAGQIVSLRGTEFSARVTDSQGRARPARQPPDRSDSRDRVTGTAVGARRRGRADELRRRRPSGLAAIARRTRAGRRRCRSPSTGASTARCRTVTAHAADRGGRAQRAARPRRRGLPDRAQAPRRGRAPAEWSR